MKKKLFVGITMFMFLFVFLLGFTVSAANYESTSVLIRSEEKKIHPDDPYTTSFYDTINISSHYKLTVAEIKAKGNDTLNLRIEFEGKEVDDGYQEILIFDSVTEKDVTKALASKTDIELTRGKVQKYYTIVTVDLTLNLDKISDDVVFIRWGAHGSGYDDWYCRNVRIYFESLN